MDERARRAGVKDRVCFESTAEVAVLKSGSGLMMYPGVGRQSTSRSGRDSPTQNANGFFRRGVVAAYRKLKVLIDVPISAQNLTAVDTPRPERRGAGARSIAKAARPRIFVGWLAGVCPCQPNQRLVRPSDNTQTAKGRRV